VSSNDSDFSLKKIAVAAYGPSLLFGIGEGAIYPVIALTARQLGASVALAGIIVALIGVGSLLNNIPAAIITSRFGERRSMMGAAVWSTLGLMLCLSASNPWVLAIGVLMMGMSNAVFLLARQTYLTEAIPLTMRARALSTLGGVTRIGMFIGPFAGAGMMQWLDLHGAYWVAMAAVISAGVLSYFIPELQHRHPATGAAKPRTRLPLTTVARTHSTTYLTLGISCLLVVSVRSCRQIIIPLWASHLGIDAATTAMIYGLMNAIDMLLFYPAGKIMDIKGRVWVAVPSMLIMGASLMAMSMTTTIVGFIIVAMILGFGNGVSSGLIMTIGADASPAEGRAQFLGIWRLLADMGSTGGPFVLSTLTALVSLSTGIGAIGLLGVTAAAMFWHWLPRKVSA